MLQEWLVGLLGFEIAVVFGVFLFIICSGLLSFGFIVLCHTMITRSLEK